MTLHDIVCGRRQTPGATVVAARPTDTTLTRLTGEHSLHVDFLCSNKGSHAYNGNIETCDKCKKTFSRMGSHKCGYCEPCDRVFSSFMRYENHKKRYHNDCDDIPDLPTTQSDAPETTDTADKATEESDVTGKPNYRTEQAKDRTEQAKDRTEQAKDKTELSIACDKCHRTFKNKQYLDLHRCSYCKICDQLFSSLHRLVTHNKKEHLGEVDKKTKKRLSPFNNKNNSISNSTNHKVLSPTSARRELLQLLEGSDIDDTTEESTHVDVKEEESDKIESTTVSNNVDNSSDIVDTTITDMNHEEEGKEEPDDSNQNETCVVETLTCQKCSKTFKGLVTLSMHKCTCCLLCVRPFSTYQRLEAHNNKYHPNSGHGNIKIKFTVPCPSSQRSDICRNHRDSCDDEEMQESSSGSEKLSEEETDEVAAKEHEEQQEATAAVPDISEEASSTKDLPQASEDVPHSSQDLPQTSEVLQGLKDLPESSEVSKELSRASEDVAQTSEGPDSTRDLVSYFHLFRSYECYVCKEKFFKKNSLDKHLVVHSSDDDVTNDVKFSNITRLLTNTTRDNFARKKLKTSHFNY